VQSSTARISRPRTDATLAQDLLAGMKTPQSRRNATFREAPITARLSIPRNAAIRVCGLVAALALIAPANICAMPLAQAAPTPLPPQRPSMLAPGQAGPASPEQTSPQPGAPANSAPATPPSAADEPIKPGVINEGPGTLLKLPSASHARMHECAVEWQNMKTTGTAVEKTWFNFALKCLTR
jgi:hypothetical protein